MRFLQSRLKTAQHLIDEGELERIARFAKSVSDNPKASRRDRIRTAELTKGIIDTGLDAAKALDPMEVEAGLYGPGVTAVRDGDEDKQDLTFTFRVTIN